MVHTRSNRTYILLVLVCLLVSMNGFILLTLRGWGTTLAAIVVGLVLATVVVSLSTPIE